MNEKGKNKKAADKEGIDRKRNTGEALIRHYREYPEMEIQDMLKFLYQSSFGCEHLLSDKEAAIARIQEEAVHCCAHTGDLTEPLNGEYCRVHLECLNRGLRAETLGTLFVLSAERHENGRELLEEGLSVLIMLCAQGSLPFSEKEVRESVEHWRGQGFLPCHHSESFRSSYAPSYRVIKRAYAHFLPLLIRIDRMLSDGPVTLAVEGGSAAGKTTLAGLLKQVYGCTVFHMDDFFLRPEQRTKERLSEPGGNVDRERILEEVLPFVKNRQQVTYRPFDCSTGTLLPAVSVMPAKLTVIEGVYSMHPELAGYYDFSVFLDAAPEVQEQRIRKRNSPALAERFFSLWIPLEHQYFEKMNIKESCDLVICVFQ